MRLDTASHTGEVLDVIPHSHSTTNCETNPSISDAQESSFGNSSTASSVVAASSIRMSLVLMRRYRRIEPSLFCEMTRTMVELLVSLPPDTLYSIAPNSSNGSGKSSEQYDVLSFGGGFGASRSQGVHQYNAGRPDSDSDARTLREAVDSIKLFAEEVLAEREAASGSGVGVGADGDDAEWFCALALLLALALAEGV
jgi:hypothetical protein